MALQTQEKSPDVETMPDTKALVNGASADLPSSPNRFSQIALGYLTLLVEWRLFIIGNTIAALVLAFIYSSFLPEWYLSSATIMIPPENDMLGIGKLLSGSIPDGILGKSSSPEVDTYESIFKSRRVRMALIEKFELRKQYGLEDTNAVEPIRKTLKVLDENLTFRDNKDGTLSLSALYKADAAKAAEMVNFAVMLIDSVNRELASENARYQRQFIEKRYEQAQAELRVNEERMNSFQKIFKVVEIKEQMRASIEASAQIEAAAVQSEVEYNLLRQQFGAENPEVQRAQQKLAEVRRQAKKFEVGGLASDMIIPFDKMPDVGMDYLRLYRNIILQQKIVEFLVPQYEQAKIQEAKNTPTLLVLDKGEVPEWKEKPKRLNYMIIAAIAVLAMSIVYVISASELKKPIYIPWINLLGRLFRLR